MSSYWRNNIRSNVNAKYVAVCVAIIGSLLMLHILSDGMDIVSGPNADKSSNNGSTNHQQQTGTFQKIRDHVGDIINRKFLQRTPRIMCLVLTAPKFHNTRAKAVIETWGKRCDHIFFLSNQDGKQYPHLNNITLYGKGKDDYSTSWDRLTVGFHHVYDNYMNEVDWIIKADDDSFLIVENMKAFLANKNPEEAVAYGVHFTSPFPEEKKKTFDFKEYNDGGGGYALSRKALKMLIEKGLKEDDMCPKWEGMNEDFTIGKCWENLGVRLGKTHDKTGQKFHYENPTTEYLRKEDHKVYKLHVHPIGTGLLCCSELTISFHHNTPEQIYVLDMLLYKIKVAGKNEINNINELVSEEQEISNI